MSTDHIRTAMGRAIRYLADHPEKARSRDKPATVVIEDGLRCRAEGPRGWTVVTDMTPGLGGGGTAPSPGWLLRAAQGTCVATMIALRSAQEGISLAALEVTVDSESDDRGLLGMDDAIPAGPLSSRTRIRIAAPGVAPERLREITKWAEAHSPVSDAVVRAVPRTIEVEIA